jgi:short-subunit dehydrogenase
MSQLQPCTLITGATGGLGNHFAVLAAQNSEQRLVLVGRNVEELKKLVVELSLPTQTLLIETDLSQTEASIKKIAQVLEKNTLWVETLVNNAGFGAFGAFLETDGQKEQSMIAVNIATLTALAKLVLPTMKEHNRGKILNVASVAAFFPGPYMSVYYATKAFVLSFSLALHEELAQTKIHVTALCPGPTETKFAQSADAEKASVFQGKLASAQDVATFGWQALQKNQSVAIHGQKSVATVALTRILPPAFVAKIIGKIQKPA